jgi:hypothetical protein
MNKNINHYLYLDKRFDFLVSMAPIIIIGIMIIMGRQIVDIDALCYHLYYARLINELNLGYYSPRPVPLEDTLGFGLSAYYPWLYSHIVASLVRLANIEYSNAAYLLSAAMYLVLSVFIKNGMKWLLVVYLFSPTNFNHFFTIGTNYSLIIFLSSMFFIAQNSKRLSYFKNMQVVVLAILAYLIIGAHVFGPYILLLLGAMRYFETREKINLCIPIFFLTIAWYVNWRLTGSPFFPFLQEYFPHDNFVKDEWYVLSNQIKKGIFYESLHGLYRYVPQILINTCIMYLLWFRAGYIKESKLIISMMFIASQMYFILGYRHRFIFDMLATFVILYRYELIHVDVKDELKRALTFLLNNKKRVFESAILAFTCIGVLVVPIVIYREKTHIGLDDVKSCFYTRVSNLSVSHKILLTELELMNITNPRNILHADGKFYSEVSKINNIDKFKEFLKEKNIEYITVTPLSSDIPWRQLNAHDKFIKQMMGEQDLMLELDCVKENRMNSELLPFYENYSLRNWKIYKVN